MSTYISSKSEKKCCQPNSLFSYVVLIFSQFMFILLIYKGPLTPRLHKHSSIFSYVYFSHLIINPSRRCVFMRKNFSQKGKPTVLAFLCQYQTSYDVFIINYQYSVFGYLGEIFEKLTLRINSKRGPPKMIKNKFKFKMMF